MIVSSTFPHSGHSDHRRMRSGMAWRITPQRRARCRILKLTRKSYNVAPFRHIVDVVFGLTTAAACAPFWCAEGTQRLGPRPARRPDERPTRVLRALWARRSRRPTRWIALLLPSRALRSERPLEPLAAPSRTSVVSVTNGSKWPSVGGVSSVSYWRNKMVSTRGGSTAQAPIPAGPPTDPRRSEARRPRTRIGRRRGAIACRLF
jgi:hypothetical protein